MSSPTSSGPCDSDQESNREENLASDEQAEDDDLLPLFHGWAGISDPGEDWRSRCAKESQSEAILCKKCQIIEDMMSVSLKQKRGFGRDRVVRLGSVEEVRKKDFCYCCRALIWLMEKRSIEPEKQICMHLILSGPRDLEIQLALVEPEKELPDGHMCYQHGSDSLMTIRPLTSKFGKETQLRTYDPRLVNLDRIRQWLSFCEQNDTKSCPLEDPVPLEPTAANPNPLTQILLVDLEKECLVTARFEARYVALSYVWGDVKAVLTTSDNLEELCQPGSLSESGRFNLPKTIKDAMYLSRLLGEKTIWVDSLCIIQDEGALKKRYLNAMGSIYANAHFTIVAAEGDNADYGIRGLGSSSTDRNVPCSILDFPFTPMMLQEEHHITPFPLHSKWASRGWTFQESILSKRLLIMDRLVTWICGRRNALEEFEDRPKRTWVYGPKDICGLHRTVGENATISRWGKLVGQFNPRDLTYESDILDSFAGISTVMSQALPRGIFHGIPVMNFEIGLLWQIEGLVRRRNAVDRDGQRLPLPSWSWLGWAGYLNTEIWNEASLGIQYFAYQRLEILPLVEWQKPAELQRTTDSMQAETTYRHPDGKMCRGIKIENPTPAIREGGNKPGSTLSNPVSFAEVFDENFSTSGPHLYFQTKRTKLKFGRIHPPSIATRAGSVVVHLVDNEERTIGALLPNIPSWETDEFSGTEETCELIAISCGKIQEDPNEQFPVHFLRNTDFALRAWYQNIGLEMASKAWFEFYNVLWVEWKDGVAYRKALGRVVKPAWDQLDLEVVDVVLG